MWLKLSLNPLNSDRIWLQYNDNQLYTSARYCACRLGNQTEDHHTHSSIIVYMYIQYSCHCIYTSKIESQLELCLL